MPELPEVETIKNLLSPILVGKKITKIEILRPQTIIGDANNFVTSLTGQSFSSISRIGKFIIFHLTNDLVLISHLRMEGKYYQLKEEEKNTYFSRVVFHLDNNTKMCYDDSRCFGIMILSNEKDYKNVKDIAHLGPEPFDIKDVNSIYERTRKSNLPIKTLITDQSLIAGIGNIYADEICFDCKLHPLTPGRKISKSKWEEIIQCASITLKQAIQSGGSTIRSYHPGKDIDGKFQVNLKAYGKAGQPCPICGHEMRFIKVNGRGTTFCPICQQKEGSPIKIAIFGPVSSGKSTVLQCFQNKGYSTISSDEVVHNLYKRKDISHKISKMFNLPLEDSVNIKLLRDTVYNNPKELKRLESFIHPLVASEISNFVKRAKTSLIVCEVPLLYQSKLDSEFDYIIGVKSKKSIELLKERNKESASQLAILNKIKQFEDYYKKADIVIDNDGSIDDLYIRVSSIICKLEDRLD